MLQAKAGVGSVAANVQPEKTSGGELARDVGPPPSGKRAGPTCGGDNHPFQAIG